MKFRFVGFLFSVSVVFLMVGQGRAQSFLQENPNSISIPNEKTSLLNRLKLARKLVSEEKWGEAISAYEYLLRDAGDFLIPVAHPADEVAGTSRSVQLRHICHQDIAHFPQKALSLYRRKVNPETKQWLEIGKKQRNPVPLHNILREAFCGSLGDEAIDLLGDLAFEEGDFATAQYWWSRLLPSNYTAPQKKLSTNIPYPEPDIDLAKIRAKLVLAYFYQGDLTRAKEEHKGLEKRYPQAKGELAGKKGKYFVIVQEIMGQGLPDFWQKKAWSTLGGNQLRNRKVAILPNNKQWQDGPTWRVPLPGKRGNPNQEKLSYREKAKALSSFPIISEEMVFVAGPSSVQTFNLYSGKELGSYQLPEGDNFENHDEAIDGLSRFSPSATEGKIVCRFGDRHFSSLKESSRKATHSYLICLNIKNQKLKEFWKTKAEPSKEEAAIFSTPPLTSDGRVFVGLSRISGFRLQMSVICFGLETGELIWEQPVLEIPDIKDCEAKVVTDGTLTLAGPNVVFCSQQGVVAAVSQDNGTISWSVRYPHRGPYTRKGFSSPRELGCCLCAEAKIFVAPMDSNRILCLEPVSGETIWERDQLQPVHLLGCHMKRLVFTTINGIRAVDADNGNDQNGWQQPVVGKLPPFGRGLIAGDWIFWPTQDPKFPLRVIHIEDGQPERGNVIFNPSQLRKITAGNFAYSNGCMVVATEKELVGYVLPGEKVGKKAPVLQNQLKKPTEKTTSVGVDVQTWKSSVRVLSLQFPLARQRKVPGDRIFFPVVSPECKKKPFFLVKGTDVLAYSSELNPIGKWKVNFSPTWAACDETRIIFAGNKGISAHSWDGGLQWSWRIQNAGKNSDEKVISKLPFASLSGGGLSEFRAVGGTVYCFQDLTCLLGFRMGDGSLVERYLPPGSKLLPLETKPAFYPTKYLGRCKFLLTKQGKILSIQGLTTRLEPGPSRPWPQNPPEIEEGKVVLIRKPSVIELVDTRKYCHEPKFQGVIWTYTPRSQSTLSGELPHFYSSKDKLLFLVPRNYGYELERVDPKTGKNLWAPAGRICPQPFSRGAICFGKNKAYYASGNLLVARSLETGRIVWQENLPEIATSWNLRLSNQHLVVYSAAGNSPKVMPLMLGKLPVSIKLPHAKIYAMRLQIHQITDGEITQQMDFGKMEVGKGKFLFFDVSLVVSAHGEVWKISAKKEKLGKTANSS